VTPIRLATGTIEAAVNVLDDFRVFAFTPDSKTVYFPDWNRNRVMVLNVATDTQRHPIPVGTNPGPIAITPDGKTVYVGNTAGSTVSAGTVTPINTATNSPGTAIKVGIYPVAIAVTP